MKLENWLSTLETNKSNEEMLNKTERNLNLQTINTNSLVYSGNNSQLYTITFQDNRKEKFPSLRQKSSIRNKKAKTLSSTSRSNSCVFVIDIKNMIKEIVADSRTERYSDEIKPNKKSNNSIINDLKPQSGSYAEQIKKVKTQNELREVRHNSRPIRQTNPQSKKVIRNNDSLELRNLIPNYKVNSNHVHKSDMRYSYLWDLIDIKERRNPIKDEESKSYPKLTCLR